MANIKSELVAVFPTTRRASGRRFTEESVATTTIATTDIDSFVCGYNGTDELRFVLHGYLFIIKKDSLDTSVLETIVKAAGSPATDVWAQIELSNLPMGTETFEEIIGTDTTGGIYTGLNLTGTEPVAASNKYKLHLLQKSGTNWGVYSPSYIRNEMKSVRNLQWIYNNVNTLINDDIVDDGLVPTA